MHEKKPFSATSREKKRYQKPRVYRLKPIGLYRWDKRVSWSMLGALIVLTAWTIWS